MRSIDKTTSKQALKELKENAQEICKWELDRLEIIEKDLEVLDILKRNIFVADNMIYATSNELEKDDYDKLKEWLENDSNKNKPVNSKS